MAKNLNYIETDAQLDWKIRQQDMQRVASLHAKRGIWAKIMLLLVLIGPGVLTMIADNDAGGVITYAQTGATYGIGFFIPSLIIAGFIAYVVQEMTVRLGAVTHRGHAEMIWGRYGSFWGWFSLVDLVIANVLTLVTEFIGIKIGMGVFGVPTWISDVLAIALDVFVLLVLRYYTWERISLWIAAGNLIFIPLVLMAKPHWSVVAASFANWNIPGGFTAMFLFIVLANFGTTIAPWMLFFQQSSVVDKGLTVKDIKHGRLDTGIGTLAMVLVALAIIVLTGSLVHGTGNANLNISQIMDIIGRRLGPTGEKLFALGLVEAGTIAAIALTASTSWAMGEAFHWPKSINMPALKAWKFYLPGILSAVLAAAIVMIPHAPLGFLNMLVQVIASIFMPAALLFLLLLLNDKEVMGEYVNQKWQNISGFVIIGLLVVLNGLYGLTVIFPNLFS
ncbi:NRAMP family divalent metal transporter [Alicyclobacillus tolerans]|uniref:NRAMP (Natural resistance-associated macrophage protein) metal ion transporters n=2 Tax=Alicyclobacillus tolerans TaxID=90970 RepID=A0A1M6N1T5_9BACL|nr:MULTISPECIES: NRAMP family divalent metal transporter [Alicyclobacillus]MDP9728086.1 NRAMP (natural resistance-associated macrophage protein)-like metal ion transporter [Alicyclobacillus tengchongensis]QRF24364.1 divalent metal cation transporter [Alicyclobacillus sp. TC]SHJ89606.1 NRAMP (natural resistance-associated macrophage protein) metal ion transporters [Alicyclobacillus montanus]